METSENSMRKDWTYSGRVLRTTVQWQDNSNTLLILVSLEPLEPEGELIRFHLEAGAGNYNQVRNRVRNVENQAIQYIDSLTVDFKRRRLLNLGFYDAYSAQDITPFDEFPEFQ